MRTTTEGKERYKNINKEIKPEIKSKTKLN